MKFPRIFYLSNQPFERTTVECEKPAGLSAVPPRAGWETPPVGSKLPETTGKKLHSVSGPRKALLVLFFLTLPAINPWVRGDGVGYYAYLRSLLIEHRLDFTRDWKSANESFVMGRVHTDGRIDPSQYTRTGIG